jgi:exosortase C (VPDSG-CTERM-specific)
LKTPSSIDRAVGRETGTAAQAGYISDSTPTKNKKTWRIWVGVCFAIVLLGAFAQPLIALINYAAASDLFSYILLIPFVSAYSLYIRRNQLPKDYVVDLPLAVVFLAVGLGAFAFTHWHFGEQSLAKADYLALQTLSFLCCLAAWGFFFLGRAWMQAAAFPLAYLIFMVPMPDPMREALELASKSASADVANLLFHLSGVPFLRAGAVFQLPNITIEVAQECSGIRSSWVLLMTSILAANLFLKTPWRRFVLVAFVIPLGILRNGFRILVIGLLCVNMGPEMIHSVIHRRGGPIFFVLSLIPFLLLLWWLQTGDIRTGAGSRAEVAGGGKP